MPTLGDLKAQVASDLRRSNLGPEIATAISDAIRDWEVERFHINETVTYTLSTVAGTAEYALAPQDPIQEFIRIDVLRAQVGNIWFTLCQKTPDEIEALYSIPVIGQPYDWRYHDNEIAVFPMPDRAYPLRIFGHYRMIPLQADTDSNGWTNEGRSLIRYSALKRLFAYPVRDSAQYQMAAANELAEAERLRREMDRRSRMGVMKAYY